MADQVLLYISAASDLEREREVLSKAVTEIPVDLGWRIVQSPRGSQALEVGLLDEQADVADGPRVRRDGAGKMWRCKSSVEDPERGALFRGQQPLALGGDIRLRVDPAKLHQRALVGQRRQPLPSCLEEPIFIFRRDHHHRWRLRVPVDLRSDPAEGEAQRDRKKRPKKE